MKVNQQNPDQPSEIQEEAEGDMFGCLKVKAARRGLER